MRVLRGAGLIAVLVGAAGSVGLVLRVGQRNPSKILITLFVVWVLAPFVGLVLADWISKSWAVRIRVALYTVMVALALGSLAIYGNPPREKPAAVFLMVPVASWVIIAIVVVSSRLYRTK